VLSVRNRVSRRDVVECCEQLFGARISSGTVDAILARVADALQEPDADLLQRVRAARALNMDETGWRTAGQRRALWGAFTDRHAVLRVRADRHEDPSQAQQELAAARSQIQSERSTAEDELDSSASVVSAVSSSRRRSEGRPPAAAAPSAPAALPGRANPRHSSEAPC
jgi:transposase-like protein